MSTRLAACSTSVSPAKRHLSARRTSPSCMRTSTRNRHDPPALAIALVLTGGSDKAAAALKAQTAAKKSATLQASLTSLLQQANDPTSRPTVQKGLLIAQEEAKTLINELNTELKNNKHKKPLI